MLLLPNEIARVLSPTLALDTNSKLDVPEESSSSESESDRPLERPYSSGDSAKPAANHQGDSRALVVEQPKSTRVEGADIVMRSSESLNDLVEGRGISSWQRFQV
jgi:hypothetical protein